MWKSLEQIADDYADSAAALRKRLAELRAQIRKTDNPEEQEALKHRIKDLTPLLTECNKLERWCRYYYNGNRKLFGYTSMERESTVTRARSEKLPGVPQVVKRAIENHNGDNTKRSNRKPT